MKRKPAGVLSMGAGAASAQEQPPAKPATQGEGAELAKKLSNPISDLVSAPFQFNWEQNVGPQKDTRGERSKIKRVNPRFRSVSTPRC